MCVCVFLGEGILHSLMTVRFDPICSEITERLFLGSETVAKDSKLLKKHGITHILNCAGTVCPEYFPTMFQYRKHYRSQLTEGTFCARLTAYLKYLQCH